MPYPACVPSVLLQTRQTGHLRSMVSLCLDLLFSSRLRNRNFLERRRAPQIRAATRVSCPDYISVRRESDAASSRAFGSERDKLTPTFQIPDDNCPPRTQPIYELWRESAISELIVAKGITEFEFCSVGADRTQPFANF